MFPSLHTFSFTCIVLCLSSVFPGFHAYLITNDTTRLANQIFDYIVVGGGTAGLTVANRLTENSNVTVLVIEAGNDEKNNPAVTNPANFAVDPGFTELTWGYSTTNQSVGGKALKFPAGKALGGSSSINGMQWTRATVAQYDAIEELGNPGWNFASLQKYMKKAEAFKAPDEDQLALGVTYSPAAHGTSGRVVSGFPNPYPCPMCTIVDMLVDSAVALFPGLRAGGDIDQCSGDPRGVARCVFSIIPGSQNGSVQNVRSSSAQSYVYSLAAVDRPNMQILVGHQAARIIWDAKKPGSLPKPAGVEIMVASSPSGSITAKVKKDVIVSSGALGTPKFLELSGIGNRTLLENLGIPVTVDLPAVGSNLQDQTQSGVSYNASMNATAPHSPVSGAAAFLTLTQMLGSEVAKAYVQDLNATLTQRAEDIVASGGGVSKAGVNKMLEAQLRQIGEQEAPVVEIVYIVGSPVKTMSGVTWNLIPQYRGSVHIVSADPLVPPSINPNYLGTESDFSLLVNASIASRRIFSSPSVSGLHSTELIPGPDVQTDDQWRAFVKNNYGAVTHPLGTASLLPRELGGVVDQNLRVYGVQGLRVADASILPIQLSAHLSSTVYGIGEKAADLIKGSPQA